MPTARRPAFTLVELLVVIGIIGLLLAVLLPALSRVRASARSAGCLAGLRELGRASLLRAGEHGGYFQPMGMLRLPDTYASGDDLAAALGDAARQRYAYATFGNLVTGREQTLVPYPRDLSAFLAEGVDDAGLFRCPSEDGGEPVQMVEFRVGDTALHLADRVRSDYAANEGVFGVALDLNATARLRGSLARIRDASRVVLFADADTRSEANVSPFVFSPRADAVGAVSLGECAKRPQDRALVEISATPSGRHRGASNVLFADGHTQSLPSSGLGGAMLLP